MLEICFSLEELYVLEYSFVSSVISERSMPLELLEILYRLPSASVAMVTSYVHDRS